MVFEEKKPAWKNIIENIGKKNEIKKQTHSQPNFQQESQKQDLSQSNDSAVKIKINVKLKSDGRIYIKPPSKKLAIILSKFPHEKVCYELTTKEWAVNIECYETISKELKKYFQFVDIPKGVIGVLIKNNKKNDGNFDLSDPIYNQLLPFQKEGVLEGLKMNGKLLLADEMGLGKTYQALAIAYYYKVEWPLLIISPASLLENWKLSIQNFLGMNSTIVRKLIDIGDKICIISYDIASKHCEYLNEQKYKVVIVDECHYLKSDQTKRTKSILPIIQKANRLVMLSGTPALSRPVELYTIFLAFDKCLFKSKNEYGLRYCNLRKVGVYFDWTGACNLEELYFLLNKCFMVRRLKDDVLNELPLKFRRQVTLDIKQKVKKKISLEEQKAYSSQIEKNDDPFKNTSVDETVMGRYREAAEIKLEPVKNYIAYMLEKDIKFLVFAHHMIMLDGLEDFMKKEKINYIRIDGKAGVTSRQNLVNKFQNDAIIKVALLGLTACATGLTLTAAKAVVFAELYWNPGLMLQAEDRVHRIGQEKNVDIHYLTALGTVDEVVWPCLLKKLSVLEKMGIGNQELKGIENIHAKQKPIEFYFNEKKSK